MPCPKILELGGLNSKAVSTTGSLWKSDLHYSREISMCAGWFFLIPWIIPHLRIGYWTNNRSEFTVLDTYHWSRWIGFGVYRNDRIRAVATIAFRATKLLVSVCIGRCPGYQQSLKFSGSRLSFDQYLYINNRYLLVVAIGVQACRSIPNA